MRRTGSPSTRRLLPVAVITAVVAFAGCSTVTEDPAPSASATSSPDASQTPTPTPAAPALIASGTAADNLPYFESIMLAVSQTERRVEGAAYIDALTTAGFDRAAMEVTADRTSVDNPADSIQFSVLWGGECIIGQVGPSTPAPTAVVTPELPDGGCLIGQTRPIDW